MTRFLPEMDMLLVKKGMLVAPPYVELNFTVAQNMLKEHQKLLAKWPPDWLKLTLSDAKSTKTGGH